MFDLSENVAVVTGGSSGLGAHFAHVLARYGANVVVTGRRPERLKEVVSGIREIGGEADWVSMDVREQGSIAEAFDQVEAKFGPADILVNNAGIAEPHSVLKVTEASWDRIIHTNLKGAWLVAVEVARRLVLTNRAGCILNIASILGLGVSFGQGAYSIGKAGVLQMTKALALELASKGVRVNALCPGYFRTAMNAEFLDSEKGRAYIQSTTAGRYGELEELTGAFLLLISNAGSFINGVALPVDGGHLVQSL